MKKYILFDLDGTLTDPALGITNSVIYALKKFNIEPPRNEELYCFIGPPLLESFEKYYSMSKDESQLALKYYREYYAPAGMFENRVYDGMEDMLHTLKESGKELCVATSKPEVYARQILEHYNLSGYFTFIGGSTLDETRVNKDEVIAYVLENMPPCRKEDIIMVGDRLHDINGANKNSIDSIGVLYGFGSCGELEDAGCTYIAHTVSELKELLMKL